MTPFEVLDITSRIERKIADIYDFFRKEFRDDEELAAFWEELVNEEEAHAGFVDAEIRMLAVKPGIFGEARVDGQVLKETLEDMIALEQEFTPGETDMASALRAALKIETELVEKRYNKLLEIGDPEIRRIFDNLTKADNHVEKLVKMAKRFGV